MFQVVLSSRSFEFWDTLLLSFDSSNRSHLTCVCVCVCVSDDGDPNLCLSFQSWLVLSMRMEIRLREKIGRRGRRARGGEGGIVRERER